MKRGGETNRLNCCGHCTTSTLAQAAPALRDSCAELQAHSDAGHGCPVYAPGTHLVLLGSQPARACGLC